MLGEGVGHVVNVRQDGCVEPRASVLGGQYFFGEPGEVLHELRAVCAYTAEAWRASRRKPLALRVLGRVVLEVWADGVRRDITEQLTPKQQELLVFLAIALEGGARREAMNTAIWPGSPPARPYNSLHNALSLLRRVMLNASDGAIRDLVVRSGAFYRLNRDIVDVDYWHFRTSAGSTLMLYRGDVGEGIVSLWLELPREAVRRRVFDGASALVKDGGLHDIPAAIDVLHMLRTLDPYNEEVYREIIRAQVKLGSIEAARRSFSLLVKMLDELGREPDIRTCNLLDST